MKSSSTVHSKHSTVGEGEVQSESAIAGQSFFLVRSAQSTAVVIFRFWTGLFTEQGHVPSFELFFWVLTSNDEVNWHPPPYSRRLLSIVGRLCVKLLAARFDVPLVSANRKTELLQYVWSQKSAILSDLTLYIVNLPLSTFPHWCSSSHELSSIIFKRRVISSNASLLIMWVHNSDL